MKVKILLSTYNGEKYLAQQLDSIFGQSIGKDNIQVIIRDDGSTDLTKDIIRDYKKNYDICFLDDGQNLGPALSFWKLILQCEIGSYYAFSDQDDIWNTDKLERAISMIDKETEIPLLYYSNAQLANSNGKAMNQQLLSKVNPLSVSTIMAGMPALGCTMVFNDLAMQKFKKMTTGHIEMHDRECLLITYLCGKVIYDDTCTMLYRQHENNVIGGGTGGTKKLFNKLKWSSKLYFGRFKYSSNLQAQDMIKYYSKEMSESNKKTLIDFCEYRRNIQSKIRLLHDENIEFLSKNTKRSYKIRLLWNLL